MNTDSIIMEQFAHLAYGYDPQANRTYGIFRTLIPVLWENKTEAERETALLVHATADINLTAQEDFSSRASDFLDPMRFLYLYLTPREGGDFVQL